MAFGRALRKFALGKCKTKVSRHKISAAVTALSALSYEEYLWSKGGQEGRTRRWVSAEGRERMCGAGAAARPFCHILGGCRKIRLSLKLCSAIRSFSFILYLFCRFISVTLLKTKN